ncbi:tRNA1(Val) (adenine(37)-N6)-methyltransferase [Sedimentitalea arenosa]|uniref:Methyltransferase domain-containing protein n=1 Tax=Sedimentitalea arenosa TaxID=2798803 RepID=A0A8J7LZZ0_9RHOB|nr:methyltransferase domain-containing protein [Arenibacterium arenosum]MBJ6373046.1 methyltransferase domain-containing protein [Arenibacterium arenosum]
MRAFTDDDLTRDAFLGGRLELLQPRSGYRAGIDPVLLAASVALRPGLSVLELGCGAGAALFCLAIRGAGLQLSGVELQPAYADLARRNAADNGIEAEIVTADIDALPDDLRQQRFDVILANPPYFRAGAHSPASDNGRQLALGETATPLVRWIEVAARRLAPKGYLHMIQRVDRLPEMLTACEGRLGSPEILPLAARAGRAADLVILRARKGGRAALRLHAPVILHDGARHERDGDSFGAHISAVLREGVALDWPAA